MAILGAVGVPFATHAVSDAIVIVGLDADMSSGAAVGGRSLRLSAVPRIVYGAKTFDEAERRLANERFDLFILDVMLPDGVVEDLLPRLKGPGRSPTTVVVFSPKEVSRETANGIRAALVKSQISNDELLQVIHLAIEKSKEVADPQS